MNHAILLALFAMIASPFAFGQGSQGSGGGALVELPDDLLVVADDYVDVDVDVAGDDLPDGATEILFSKELKHELLRMSRLMLAYTGSGLLDTSDRRIFSYTGFTARNPLFDEHIFHTPQLADDGTPQLKRFEVVKTGKQFPRYFLVDSIPEDCPYQDPIYFHPPAGSNAPIKSGCTKGMYTYFIREHWLDPNFVIREKARFVLHERLRAVLGSTKVASLAIAAINQGMGVLLEQYNREVNGQFQRLSLDDVEKIETMRVAIVNALTPFYMNYRKDWNDTRYTPGLVGKVHPSGGGLVASKSAQIDQSAYIGVGVILTDYVQQNALKKTKKIFWPRVEAGAKILGPGMVCFGCEIGKSSTIHQVRSIGNETEHSSFDQPQEYASEFKSSNALLFGAGRVIVGEESVIRSLVFHQEMIGGPDHSFIDIPQIKVGTGVTLEKVNIELKNADSMPITRRHMRNLIVEDRVNIKNLSLQTDLVRTLNRLGMLPAMVMLAPYFLFDGLHVKDRQSIIFQSGLTFDGQASGCNSEIRYKKPFGRTKKIKRVSQLMDRCK